jgi:hypothetical protein
MPEKTMPGFMHVHRNRVMAALVWLKTNNPIYANIEISEDRLNQLDEDGIPLEIIEAVRYSDDVVELDREWAGYVPEDEDYELRSDGLVFHHERGECAAGTW